MFVNLCHSTAKQVMTTRLSCVRSSLCMYKCEECLWGLWTFGKENNR